MKPKFRAFANGHMFEVTDILWRHGEIVYIRGRLPDGTSIGGHKDCVDISNLMQFTGLHDRNKKEIYGDDIIKYFDDKSGNFLNLHIVLKNGCWIGEFKSEDYICGECESNCGFWFLYQVAEKSEVIGNICKNPELLEKK